MGLNDPSGSAAGRWLQLVALRLLMKTILRFEVSGAENIPPAGPVIIVINHIAFLDPVMVLGSVPRRVVPMAKAEAFELPVFGLFVKVYGTIPVRRGEADMNAVKYALRCLKNGDIVLMAPEGTRSRNYQLQPAKDGAAVLALRSGAPIVPVGVTGTHRAQVYWRRLQRPPVRLSVGRPFKVRFLDSDNGRPSRRELSEITTEIMYQLAAQLPPEFRGVYCHLEQATQTHLLPI